jgi:hypothetical protein
MELKPRLAPSQSVIDAVKLWKMKMHINTSYQGLPDCKKSMADFI